jgi:hypothetical protein
MVEALLDFQGNDLYIGAELDRLTESSALKRRSSRVSPVAVTNCDAAALFFLNMQSWKHQPFIQASYPAAMIDQLQEELAALAQGDSSDSEITFGLRQVICERV